MRKSLLLLLTACALPVHASETTTYSYDALGRLVSSVHSGTVNNGLTTTTTFDAASNRTNQTVTGALNAVFSIASASANEGSPLNFVVSRSGTTSNAVTVNWSTSDGTAIAGTNYTAASGVLSFAAGVTSKTFAVTTKSDGVYTPSLSLNALLSSPSAGASIGAGTAVGTISNTDVSKITIASASVNEGGTLLFTVSRTGNLSQPVSASWATSDGTAKAGVNYVASSGVVNFTAGASTAQVSVQTLDDATTSANLSFNIALSAPSAGATLGAGSSTYGYVVNTGSTILTVSPATANEGQPVRFVVTRSGGVSQPLTGAASLFLTAGTAKAGINYYGLGYPVDFRIGSSTTVVSVPTYPDGVSGGNLVFNAQISPNSGNTNFVTPGNGAVAGTIVDTGAAAMNPATTSVITVADTTSNAGSPLIFVMRRQGYAGQACTINYTLSNGTAQSGTHFQGFSGVANFPASTNNTQVLVMISVPTYSIPGVTGYYDMSLNITSGCPNSINSGQASGVIVY